MAITSTVPAAMQVLAAYMNSVANANPALNPGVYVGLPVESVRNNYMMVGDTEGKLFTPDSYSWAAVPGLARLRKETYALLGTVRAYSGGVNISARVGEVLTLINGLQELIVTDMGGNAVGLNPASPATDGGINLSDSGSWGGFRITDQTSGPINGQGWGVVVTFEIDVINAQITG